MTRRERVRVLWRVTRGNRTRAIAGVIGATLIMALVGHSAASAAEVTGEQVKRAIHNGVRALKRAQFPEGTWPERFRAGGETCLATLALLTAGEPPESDTLRRPLAFIRLLPNDNVYVTSLKVMTLARANPKLYAREIEAGAKWLMMAQNGTGLWDYGPGTARFDHSNSQFALLGLYSAAEAGVKVPGAVWQRAQTAVLRTQRPDGGWAYQADGSSYGSMTAAGVADLLVLGHSVEASAERQFKGGAAPNCGHYLTDKPLANGLKWLARNFQAGANPGRGQSFVNYWLYAVERCGMLSGQRTFGIREWYREGAAHLVEEQGFDGMWNEQVADTAFALLFLAKGHKPILIQKLQWSDDQAWNPDRHDLEHLIDFVGDKLGEPTTWQIVRFDDPLEDWLAAPILYVQGHEFPKWSREEAAKVRAFVEQGGILLAEACCGSQPFKRDFKKFAEQTFPEAPLHDLGAEHAVYSAVETVEPYGLMGIDLGCRTSVIFSPNDLSCLWEQADVPKLSPRAFAIGLNIAAFATGNRALRDRLDVIALPKTEAAIKNTPPVGSALRLAQVVYEGDWRTDALSLVHFAEFLRDNAQLNVVTQYRALRLTDADLYTSPILFLTGHYKLNLSPAEREALAAHLRRGGFLLADACCGREAFDLAFRKLVRDIFPDATLERLPADHPIFRGEPGFPVKAVRYKEAVLRETPDATAPELWGLSIDGRLAVVYSPFGLGCGLDGHVCFGCRGVETDDARRLAANIVLYALTR